jgi:glycosyltransferase involved in cell wall biosynthesis
MIVGNESVLTPDRLRTINERLDQDPRIASVSVVGHPDPQQQFLRATAPAGCAVVIATDVMALTGPVTASATPADLASWARLASDRGLWHDWWLTPDVDVARAPVAFPMSPVDRVEVTDVTTAHHHAIGEHVADPHAVSITVDGTWLGPHQTGAQVLTTAALEALAVHPNISRLRLVGVTRLPAYAAHLAEYPRIEIIETEQAADEETTDVIWYPNQIDHRVDISYARSLGRRVITTYLDLIAYDIPRYHASEEAWVAYRALQRRIALSVDGITTISADVAQRLLLEAPRLDPARVQPIPLGLDHIAATATEPGEDLTSLLPALTARPFVLVLGNDFGHKNRDFAIQVWEQVLDRGVSCDLVLAGLHVRSSSSKDAEDALLRRHTNLRGSVHRLGHVDAASREWLLEHAGAVLYPSSAEGFGFVPYEAAVLGTPSTFVGFGPLAEISGVPDLPTHWSIDQCAADLQSLLTDPESARGRVRALDDARARLTWTRFADALVEFIVHIDAMPPVEAALVSGTSSDTARLTAVLNSATWRMTAPLRRLGKRRKR